MQSDGSDEEENAGLGFKGQAGLPGGSSTASWHGGHFFGKPREGGEDTQDGTAVSDVPVQDAKRKRVETLEAEGSLCGMNEGNPTPYMTVKGNQSDWYGLIKPVVDSGSWFNACPMEYASWKGMLP